jgi:hypothetical protein
MKILQKIVDGMKKYVIIELFNSMRKYCVEGLFFFRWNEKHRFVNAMF